MRYTSEKGKIFRHKESGEYIGNELLLINGDEFSAYEEVMWPDIKEEQIKAFKALIANRRGIKRYHKNDGENR